MEKLNILSDVSEEALLDCINSLSDDEKANFVIRLGEDGDLSYELKLLNKLITIISEMYPPNDKNDPDISSLSQSLLLIQPFVNKLIN